MAGKYEWRPHQIYMLSPAFPCRQMLIAMNKVSNLFRTNHWRMTLDKNSF